MGTISLEPRGRNKYLYYCHYDERRHNTRRVYLGPANDAEADRKGRLLMWLDSFTPEKVSRLKTEAASLRRLNIPFETALERVFRLRSDILSACRVR